MVMAVSILSFPDVL